MGPISHLANQLIFRTALTIFLVGGYVICLGQVDSLSNHSEFRLNLSGFVDNIFLYPDFMPGKIALKDGTVVPAKLNYDRVLRQLLFLGRGKTLAFAQPEALDYVTVANDTFNYFDHLYLRKITHDSKINLFASETLTYYVKTESGILGTSVVVISSNSNPAYKSESLSKPDNELSANSTFVFENILYVKDQSGKFYEATKRNIMELFPDKFAQLRNYFQTHTVRFSNVSEMERFVEFLNTL